MDAVIPIAMTVSLRISVLYLHLFIALFSMLYFLVFALYYPVVVHKYDCGHLLHIAMSVTYCMSCGGWSCRGIPGDYSLKHLCLL